jgi:hypothetical protein
MNKAAGLKAERKAEFLKRIGDIDLNDPAAAFPLPTWRLEGNVKDFYEFYGIE